MRPNDSNKEWHSEFNSFMEEESVTPPLRIKDLVHEQIFRDLNPASWKISLKMVTVMLITLPLNLFLCPQFGMGFLEASGLRSVLMPYIMIFGIYGCMALCGAIFIGTTTLIASFVFRPEEVKVIRSQRILQLSFLSLLALGSFVCFGADVFLSTGLVWLLGAVLGGAASLELGWRVRERFAFAGI